MTKTSEPWSVVRRVNPVTRSRPCGLDADDDADGGGRTRWRAGIAQAAVAEQERGGAASGDDRDEASAKRLRCVDPRLRSGTGAQCAAALAATDPVPVLPGAWSGVPSAQRGQVAGPGS